MTQTPEVCPFGCGAAVDHSEDDDFGPGAYDCGSAIVVGEPTLENAFQSWSLGTNAARATERRRLGRRDPESKHRQWESRQTKNVWIPLLNHKRRSDAMSKQIACKLCGAPFRCDNGMWFTTCECARLRPDELAAAPKRRVSFLTVNQTYNLNQACRPVASLGYGTFHVGSSLERADYHDVDLRCMLADEEYDRIFPSGSDSFRLFLNAAISEWLAARSGLPIDFQFQRATEANKEFSGRRNGVGL